MNNSGFDPALNSNKTQKRGRKLPMTKSQMINKPSTYDRGEGIMLPESDDMVFDQEPVIMKKKAP